MITDLLFENGDFVLDAAGDLQVITGIRVIAQDLSAQLQCPPGAHWAFPDLGVDLGEYLLAGLDETTVLEMRQEVEIEAMKDDRVLDLVATVTLEDLRSCRVALRAELTDATLEDLNLDFLVKGDT
ncbi:hypothetical protein [Deinococcus misasensis]|uniref:hypothetical protein n=1 Tax=Deinococcus misasensis TaxID=392413 RepID=UPI00055776E9|nr:hypothetical protein [Deinococcus misasensis]